SALAGMHRFSWDMKYQPISEGVAGRGGGGGGGAVPHRTYPSVNAPWAPPGSYKVRLTSNGKSYTHPLEVHLDPRVNAQSPGVQTLTSLTKEMYDGARAAHAAAEKARALVAELDTMQGSDVDGFKAKVAPLAAPASSAQSGRGAGGGGRAGRGPSASSGR